MENKAYKCLKGSCLHAASVKSTVGNKLGFLLAHSTFLLAHASIWAYAGAFRNDWVAACSTGRRSATDKNELRGYVLCSSKMTQHISTADWLKF